MYQVISFQDALKMANSNKHLLLGNGFSIDWNKDIFRYEALVKQADFSSLSVDDKELFGLLSTSDFELVIDALKKASLLARLYFKQDQSLSKKFSEDAYKLKDILATTIAKNHPDQPRDVKDSEYKFCRNFLSNFSTIYTLNYDLLLYWVLMHDQESIVKIKCDDGFRDSEDEQAEYVVWDNGSAYSQNIHYLHGALHLFDAGTELQKFTWSKSGVRLITQIKDALDRGLFPLIVAEGTSDDKKTRVNHSGYLSKAKRSFSLIGGNLFIHGHSLADNDDHIISLIADSKVNNLFISTMSDPNSPENAKKILKVQNLIDERKELLKKVKKTKKAARTELSVFFYDASSAHVWR